MCVTLDLCVHACITASHLDCSVTGQNLLCVALVMSESVEQCICITFCQKLANLCSETYDMIQKAFGNEAMGHMLVKEWMSVKSDEHSGGSLTSRTKLMIDKVCSAMLDNQRIRTRELSDRLGLSHGLVQSILTEDLGIKCISVKFVPKMLTDKQKETHLAAARDLLQCVGQDANYMKTLITGDESWVYGYDPETKAQ